MLQCLASIMEMGYTRVPVYAGNQRDLIFALLNVKDLIFLNPEERLRVSSRLTAGATVSRPLPALHRAQTTPAQARFVFEEMPASRLMEEMIAGRSHLCLVARFQHRTYSVVGLITLEDIIEEVIGEIYVSAARRLQCARPGRHRQALQDGPLRRPGDAALAAPAAHRAHRPDAHRGDAAHAAPLHPVGHVRLSAAERAADAQAAGRLPRAQLRPGHGSA